MISTGHGVMKSVFHRIFCYASPATVGLQYTAVRYNTKLDVTWSDLGPLFMEST